ncbi:hypothetical protein BDA99DRAFT_524142 [Phascolomyces articulosus]|uniref:Uncharacterized protein n=1 Tax=Phascolomyces articulosus TaxID=60185 RepID=A0AAD5P9C4_9FUNG|nr:hypothetical protein BDA99DRAFT_524142 [Phascolomyces articulosus]
MSAPTDETKVTVKRGFTKRAGKKVRNLLKRARGKKDHAGSSADDEDHLSSSMMNTSTSNLSSGGSLTTETDEDEFDSKLSLGSSSGGRPEKTADRSIQAPHDGYRSRKISTASNYEKYYDRQRVSLDNSRQNNSSSMDHRKRTMSSPTSPKPPTGVFSSNKQSSSIIVVPAAAAVLSPPVSPTSLMMPASSSDYSVTTSSQSVEELSIASAPLGRNDNNKEVSSVVLVPPTTNKEVVPVIEKQQQQQQNKASEEPLVEKKKEKEETTTAVQPYTTEQPSENVKENIITVDENSYVLPSKTTTTTTTITTTSTPASTHTSDESITQEDNSTTSKSTAMIIVGQEEVSKRVAYFDKKHRGKITMLDTFASLRGLGYHWMFAIPATLIMHLRLSPLTTSPHHAGSLRDWLSWPIYTERVAQALVNHTPWMHRREQVTKWIDSYGHHKNSVRGLTFWDGFRALRGAERTTLRWWQFKLWLAHRLQWILTYSILHDPQTRMVTQPALEYLCPPSSSSS